jgi:nicotinamidase-related amidase
MKLKSIPYLISISLAFGGGIGSALIGVQNFAFFEKPVVNELERGIDHSELPELKNSLEKIYSIEALSRSYFLEDSFGALIPENGKRTGYYKVSEKVGGGKVYKFDRQISNTNSALIVMDPWKDSGSAFLTSYNEKIIKSKVTPLVRKAIALGIPVLILTNSPDLDLAYGSQIHPELEKLLIPGRVEVIFHQSTNSEQFSEWLREISIDTLIYSGFSSNMCVIGRDLGMIPMRIKGFKLFFVPEASAAVEFGDSWNTGNQHKLTTSLISQWIGEIIRFEDFINL